MPWYTCEGQMPNLGSLFSPPTMWSYSSDSGWEGWWEVSLLTKPSHGPSLISYGTVWGTLFSLL